MGASPGPTPESAFSLRRIGKAAGLLAVAGAAGQVISVLRELFVASQVGASPGLDAVLVAMTPPIVLAGVVSSGVRAALVPAYVETETRFGTPVARNLLGALLTWIVVIATAASLVLMLVPTVAVSIAGPGLNAGSRAAAASYERLVAPVLLVETVIIVLSGVCQIHNRFAPIAVSLLLGPFVSLATTVLLWPSFDLGALPVAFLVGETSAALALLAVAARSGMLPRPRFSFGSGDVRAFVRHAGPLAAGSAILQFNLLSDRAIASLIGAGSVSALRYGQQLVIQPLGAVTTAWSTVVYPAIVRRALDRVDDLGKSLQRAMRAAIALATPASVWMAAASPLVVEVVYRRGAFDASDVATTTSVVAGFAPMIVLGVVQPVLTGAHNARRRATLLAAVAVAYAVFNVVLNVAFGVVLGVGGVALSTSFSVFILLGFMASRVSEPGFDARSIAIYAVRTLAASGLAVVPTVVVVPMIPQGLGLGLVPIISALGLSMAAVYLIVAPRLGVTEPVLLVAALRARVLHRG
jgi:putative peptidoglycan lipid II flippase